MTSLGMLRKKLFSPAANPLRACFLLIYAAILLVTPRAHAQGSRKDGIALGASGKPLAGATVTVCSSGATGAPCSPLATLYTDATLSVPSANPLQADTLGNYHFYAVPGRYVVQISDSGNNTYTMNDTILPNDPTTPSFNSITATSIALGGNLKVGGNANVTGTLSVGTFAPSSISTGSLQVSGNASTKGPRPWVDVVSYGADPTFTSDSTTAITNAIATICTSWPHPGGAVHFPPGEYKTTSTITIPACGKGGLTLEGGATANNNNMPQFSRPPMTMINGGPYGGSNTGPVFMVNSSSGPVTFRDLNINGYNQAVQLNSTTYTTFDNVCLSVVGTSSGIRTGATDNTDNTPLAIYNTFAVAYRGGCLVNSSRSLTTPIAVFAFLAQAPPNLGLIQFRDVIGSGGGFIWDCRGTSIDNNCPNGGGNVFFDNVYIENATMPFYTINNTAGSLVGGVPAIFHDAALYDCTGWPFMNYNGGGSLGISAGSNGPVHMENVSACPGSAVLTVTSGSVSYASMDTTPPTNTDGVPSGNAIFKSAYGLGLLSSNVNVCNQNVEEETIVANGGGCGSTRLPPLAFVQSGNTQANLGISPYYGYEFGDGTHYGYETNIARNSVGTLDIQMACAIAPTGLTATPKTGGSLDHGTYRYSIQSVCASGGAKSAGSNEVSVTLSGSNNAVSLAWTAPAGTDPQSCNIYRSKSSGGTFSSATYYTVSNCISSTTFTDTGARGSAGANQLWNASLGAYYRFVPSGANPSGGTVEIGLSGMTASIGGSALSAGQCASGKASVINAAVSMPVAVSPSTWPGDGFSINGYVSASGTVTVKVCAIVAGTPSATKYNVRVLQ
jgi:hypothetical protein